MPTSKPTSSNFVTSLKLALCLCLFIKRLWQQHEDDDKVDNPVSLDAATKKTNELMAHAYSKLYNIPSTILRFFIVYVPAGRPDMTDFGFSDKLVKGDIIQIFNFGNCKRDFPMLTTS